MTDDKDATHRAIIHAHNQKKRGERERRGTQGAHENDGSGDGESVVVFGGRATSPLPCGSSTKHTHTRAHTRPAAAIRRERTRRTNETNDSNRRRGRASFQSTPFGQPFVRAIFPTFPHSLPWLCHSTIRIHNHLTAIRSFHCAAAIAELIPASRRRQCAGASRFLARETKFSFLFSFWRVRFLLVPTPHRYTLRGRRFTWVFYLEANFSTRRVVIVTPVLLERVHAN